MSKSTYYRILGQIDAKTLERIYEIAKTSTVRHLERTDELETIKQEMWADNDLETEPHFKVRILKQINEFSNLCLSMFNELN